MKVYSSDLREKVLKAYNDKEGSMRELAERFMVSLNFVFIRNLKPRPVGVVIV